MEQINKIELRGAVGSVSVQTYAQGRVAHFTMATNYAYKDKNGAAVIETTWHNVTAWEGKEITNLDAIQKGSKIYVTGRLRIQKFTGSDGIDRLNIDVLANHLVLITEQDQLSYEM